MVQIQSRAEVGDPVQKITKTKRFGCMAQVVEHLPSKCKALNWPSTTKERKQKKNRIILPKPVIKRNLYKHPEGKN
jgi:hypothetical protein